MSSIAKDLAVYAKSFLPLLLFDSVLERFRCKHTVFLPCMIVFSSYELHKPVRQQFLCDCEYWCSKRRSCSLRKRLRWQSTLHLSVRLWVAYTLLLIIEAFAQCKQYWQSLGCEHFIRCQTSGSVSILKRTRFMYIFQYFLPPQWSFITSFGHVWQVQKSVVYATNV